MALGEIRFYKYGNRRSRSFALPMPHPPCLATRELAVSRDCSCASLSCIAGHSATSASIEAVREGKFRYKASLVFFPCEASRVINSGAEGLRLAPTLRAIDRIDDRPRQTPRGGTIEKVFCIEDPPQRRPLMKRPAEGARPAAMEPGEGREIDRARRHRCHR